jgi:hypothetical protein
MDCLTLQRMKFTLNVHGNGPGKRRAPSFPQSRAAESPQAPGCRLATDRDHGGATHSPHRYLALPMCLICLILLPVL